MSESAMKGVAAARVCRACGAVLAAGARFCGACGAAQSSGAMVPAAATGREVFCRACGRAINAAAPFCPGCGAPQAVRTSTDKDRLAAGLLAIFLGGFGVHKFYLGRPVQGILYLVFCWTFVPAIIGFIEGIVYLCMSEAGFARRYGRGAP